MDLNHINPPTNLEQNQQQNSEINLAPLAKQLEISYLQRFGLISDDIADKMRQDLKKREAFPGGDSISGNMS